MIRMAAVPWSSWNSSSVRNAAKSTEPSLLNGVISATNEPVSSFFDIFVSIAGMLSDHSMRACSGQRATCQDNSWGKSRDLMFTSAQAEATSSSRAASSTFDPAAPNATGNQDHAAAAIIRGPAREPGGRMENVLDAMNDGRLLRALPDIDNTLEAQKDRIRSAQRAPPETASRSPHEIGASRTMANV